MTNYIDVIPRGPESPHTYLTPTCQWVGTRNPHPDLWPGDKVTLCTAQRIWTITSVDGSEATLTASGIDELLTHVAHLERVETDPDEHGELPGQAAFDLGDVA